MELIWRDDDIYMTKSLIEDIHFYNLKQFKKIHKLLTKRRFIHTLAIIASEIDKYPKLTKYLLKHKNECSFQSHGWEHLDYSEMSENDIYYYLDKANKKIEKTFCTKVTTFYAPYNKFSQKLRNVCNTLRLELNDDFVLPVQWLKGKRSKTVNFHYWAVNEKQMDDFMEMIKLFPIV